MNNRKMTIKCLTTDLNMIGETESFDSVADESRGSLHYASIGGLSHGLFINLPTDLVKSHQEIA